MASLAFDATFYLSQNPDVATAIARGQFASAEDHYNKFGAFEGRNPNAYFDSAFYLAQNPDVLNARANPFQHFLQFGAAEGRFENNTADSALDTNGNNRADEFDSATYLASNKDVADAITAGTLKSAYQHYVLFGQFEGRPGVNVGPFTNNGIAPNTGSTLTLTSGTDNLVGTSANDTFVAAQSETAGQSTLQSGDVLNGGAGTDTLRIVATNTTSQTVVPTLSNIENIEYQGFTAGVNSLNLASSTGVKGVSLVNGNSSLTLTNQANIVTLGASNTTGGTLTAGYAASVVSGTTDVQNVTLNNTASTTISVAGVETVNIAATGTNTGATLTAAAATTVNVSGAGSLALAALGTGVTTFNASANTGGVTVAFTDGANVTATGGSGNDTFNFGTGLTATAGTVAGDVVNGGEGFDTVRVSTATTNDFSSAANAAAFNQLVSIERVSFDGTAGATVNGSTFTNTGITNIEFNTSNADIINNAGSARTYEFGVLNGGDATFNANAATTTLNIDLLGTVGSTAVSGATNTVEIGTLTANLAGTQPTGTVATIDLSSLGNFTAGTIADTAGTLGLTAGTFNSIATITAASGSTVKIDGSAALSIGSFTNNAIVDASAHTGSLVIHGSAFGSGNLGGSAAGATVVTQGIDTITLGAGRDVVQFNANGLDSGIIQFTGAAGSGVANNNVLVDTINAFTAGVNGDVLDITGTAATFTALTAATQTAINALSGASATLLDAANAAANGNTGIGWTAFSFQGTTYALYETDTNANGATSFQNVDTLVKLAGVNVADLVSANFA